MLAYREQTIRINDQVLLPNDKECLVNQSPDTMLIDIVRILTDLDLKKDV